MICRLSGVTAICLLALNACSGETKASAAQPRVEKKEGSVPPRIAAVVASAVPYRAINVTGGATIGGTVDFAGAIPADSVIQFADGRSGCGRSVTDERVQHSGSRIGGTVVWLTDIRAGKPMSAERRFELSNKECLLTPRIQAVLAPGTLNVASEDVEMHRTRIINVGTGETEAIAPFNDNGEVVPLDRLLTKPAQLEVICDLHPWSKAWILVFDHPYSAVSSRTGEFGIDNVPPGTYNLKAWHPVLGTVEQAVTVTAGQSAKLVLQLSGPAQAAPPAAAPGTAAPANPGTAAKRVAPTG